MTKIFENQYFSDFDDRDSGAVFDGYEFRNCEFGSVGISITRDPALRSTIRNCKFLRSKITGSPSIRTAIIEDTLIDTVSSSRPPLIVLGAVFNRVVLRGPIGPFMLGRSSGYTEDNVRLGYEAANAAYYETVDWALDISQAEFTGEATFKSVPGRLVVRDPATQVLITREKLQAVDWQTLEFGDTSWEAGLHDVISGLKDSVVFAAATRGKNLREEMRLVEQMKSIGLAEPDSVGLIAGSFNVGIGDL